MRTLIVVAVMLGVANLGKAQTERTRFDPDPPSSKATTDEGKQYVLRNGQVTLEERVGKIETDVASIKADHAEFKTRLASIDEKLKYLTENKAGGTKAGGPIVNPNWNTRAAAPADTMTWVCDPVTGVCRRVASTGATAASSTNCPCMATGVCQCSYTGACSPGVYPNTLGSYPTAGVLASYPTATFGSYPLAGGFVGAGDTMVCGPGGCYPASGAGGFSGGTGRSGPLRRLFGR